MAATMAVPTSAQNERKPPINPAILDKKLGTVRRSTPDSEALTSSDDEHDEGHNLNLSLHSVRSLPQPTTTRRPSWLDDIQASSAKPPINKPRQHSVGGMSFASSGSQPTTPFRENGAWEGNAGVTRSGANGSSYPFTPAPHTPQSLQKDRSRLVEMMPSSGGSPLEEMRSPTYLNQMAKPSLPFEIPLEPNRKTVRSQSYSAGQLENMSGFENSSTYGGFSRMRPNLMHRPSRPSMLGDGSRDMLGSLREDEDDVQSSNGSDRAQQSGNTRSGVGLGMSATTRPSATSPLQSGGHRFQPRASATFPLSPGSDYAVADENDENGDNLSEIGLQVTRGIVSSNASSATNLPSMATAIENRRLEGLKRSQWQSSLGFGLIEEGSQSRRHSFAEPPTRTQNSPMMTSSNLTQAAQYQGFGAGFPSLLGSNESYHHEPSAEERKSETFNNFTPHQQLFYQALVRLQRVEEGAITKVQTDAKAYAVGYFSGNEAQRRHMRESASEDYNPFAVPNVFSSRPMKILYVVAFKCNRADIYYIPENTGLQVKAGDTVIVEGDRGQDLGTVEKVNITMDQAKQAKEEYTQKHFRCLMMFSRLYPHIAALAGDDQAFANSIGPASANGGSLLPGVASAAPNFSPDPTSQFEPEPRPKMIKRVARPDEVHLLREKEGNEAKAKRVCQTKVNDHGLRMEILDAEFQHDYRKLTFFYYAEEYINFNELVTDLFKVYKTRIWMSAINPSTYMAMNPNTHPRGPPRPAPQGHAANYLRAQEDFRTAVENGRTASPVDRDGPAARGNREYERVMQMQNGMQNGLRMGAQASMGAHEATSTMPGSSSGDFPATMQPYYDPRRAATSYAPNSSFATFAHQYGPNVAAATAAWGQNGTSNGYPFMFPNGRDTANNYAVAPIGAMPQSFGLNQQAAAFTPRAAMPQQQYTNNGYSNNESEMQKLLNEQFQRFAIDTTRRA